MTGTNQIIKELEADGIHIVDAEKFREKALSTLREFKERTKQKNLKLVDVKVINNKKIHVIWEDDR